MKELTFIIVHLYTKSVCGEHIGLKLVSDYHRPSAWFHNSLIWLKFNPNYFMQIIHTSDKFIRNVQTRIYSLLINLLKHQLYLLEQHSESFIIWSAIIRINTEGKSIDYEIQPW